MMALRLELSSVNKRIDHIRWVLTFNDMPERYKRCFTKRLKSLYIQRGKLYQKLNEKQPDSVWVTFDGEENG